MISGPCETNGVAFIWYGISCVLFFFIGVILAVTAPAGCPSGCTEEACTATDSSSGDTSTKDCTCDDGSCSNIKLTSAGQSQSSAGVIFILYGVIGFHVCGYIFYRRRMRAYAATLVAADNYSSHPTPVTTNLSRPPVIYHSAPMYAQPPGGHPQYPMGQYPYMMGSQPPPGVVHYAANGQQQPVVVTYPAEYVYPELTQYPMAECTPYPVQIAYATTDELSAPVQQSRKSHKSHK